MNNEKYYAYGKHFESVKLIESETRSPLEYRLKVTFLEKTEDSLTREIYWLKIPMDEYEMRVELNNGQGNMNLGFGKLQIDKYATEILEEKQKTMTLAEIEKRLGYKINLVSEKNRE
jgi:hypothetical protein